MWTDTKIESELVRQNLGLIPERKETETLKAEVHLLAQKIQILEQAQKVQKEQIELQSQKTTQTEAISSEIRIWAKKREQDFLDIEVIAEELKEEKQEKEKFKNDNR